mgnify:CR=1 FL=1
MRKTWGLLDEYPPYLVRCFAKKRLSGKRIRAISDEEIAIVSQIPLIRVREIYDSASWNSVLVEELRAFCSACEFDPEDSSDRNRLTAYKNSKGGPKFTYLRRSPQWESVFKPLIRKYFNAPPRTEKARNSTPA